MDIILIVFGFIVLFGFFRMETNVIKIREILERMEKDAERKGKK